jgi:hypothetical protein
MKSVKFLSALLTAMLFFALTTNVAAQGKPKRGEKSTSVKSPEITKTPRTTKPTRSEPTGETKPTAFDTKPTASDTKVTDPKATEVTALADTKTPTDDCFVVEEKQKLLLDKACMDFQESQAKGYKPDDKTIKLLEYIKSWGEKMDICKISEMAQANEKYCDRSQIEYVKQILEYVQ